MISVILPHYNDSKHIARAIESICAQEGVDMEIIIIDDASRPEEFEKLQTLVSRPETRARITLLRNTENMGLARSLNKAITASSGEYIARIDSDDVWIDESKLKQQLKAHTDNPNLVLSGTRYVFGKNIEETSTPPVSEEGDTEIRQVLLYKNPFCHSSIFFPKRAFEKAGGYNPKLRYTEDHDLWIRMSRIGVVEILPIRAVFYRTQNTGMSAQTSKFLKHSYQIRMLAIYWGVLPNRLRAARKIVSDIFGLHKLKSFFTTSS